MKKACLLTMLLVNTGMLYSDNSQEVAASAKKTWFGTSEKWGKVGRGLSYSAGCYFIVDAGLEAIKNYEEFLARAKYSENLRSLFTGCIENHLERPIFSIVVSTTIMKLVWESASKKNECVCTAHKEQAKE